MTMTGQAAARRGSAAMADAERRPLGKDDVVIGKDVLELISSAMYVDR